MIGRFPISPPDFCGTLLAMEALIVAGGIVGVQLAAGLGAGLFIVLKVRRGPQRQAARPGR